MGQDPGFFADSFPGALAIFAPLNSTVLRSLAMKVIRSHNIEMP
jgi:hypothetical protein